VKRLLLIVAVAALALTLVPLAVAGGPGGGWKHGHAKFNLVGNVTAVAVADPADPAAVSTITVKVKAGSHIKGLRGTEKAFDVAAGAKVWQLTPDGAVAMTLGDVAAGDRVKVKGKISKAEDGSRVYTITSIKYRDRTPEEVTPPPAE
jgi:hypothetical protein